MKKMHTTDQPESTISPKISSPRPSSPRLVSLDVMRGFDMFWISGGGEFLVALLAYLGCDSLLEIARYHTEHVGWAGLVAWDLIFPIFVFMSGVTIPFALTARLERGTPKRVLYWRICRRMLLLVLLGLLPDIFSLDFANMRPLSVLGLIGIAYFIAGMVVIHRGVRGQFAWIVGLLVGYWAALTFIPVPGIGAGVITPGGCLNAYVDYHILPGKLYGGVFDPEGILCMMPAAALALIGVLAGHLLRVGGDRPYRNVLVLLCAGGLSLGFGLLWSVWFPIVKALWSSSFILAAGGWGLILLALFYLVIDVWRCRWLGFFFIPIGMNAITIYVANMYVNFADISERIFGGLARLAGGQLGTLVAAAGVIAVQWALLYFLYRKKIFLRV